MTTQAAQLPGTPALDALVVWAAKAFLWPFYAGEPKPIVSAERQVAQQELGAESYSVLKSTRTLMLGLFRYLVELLTGLFILAVGCLPAIAARAWLPSIPQLAPVVLDAALLATSILAVVNGALFLIFTARITVRAARDLEPIAG